MKTIVMLSGGLDSSLALKLIRDQNIEVVALHFVSSFCRCDGSKGCGFFSRNICDKLGVELKIIHLSQEYFEMVKSPKHGYGKNMNPCIDCRILKFKQAKKIMQERNASFVITGEVLGQRPMSQYKQAMALIEKESGLSDLIVRPLSAKLLTPSLPERLGWVNRNAFLDFQGRSRLPQIKLASSLKIKDYPCPAGGCLLTDPGFCRRLKDLFKFGKLDMNNAELLKLGRHFRLTPKAKLIVGRNEGENRSLGQLKTEKDLWLEPGDVAGPVGLLRGEISQDEKTLAAEIVASYTTACSSPIVVTVQGVYETETLTAVSKGKEWLVKWRL